MVIIDSIAECDDGRHRDRTTPIEGIAIHRFGLNLAHDAAGIARFYRFNKSYTGGQMPYTYVIGEGGATEQALRVPEVGPHARRWNSRYMGIVFLGDFRKTAVPAAQWYAGVSLVAELSSWLGAANIRGHDELPGGSSDPNKECPGDLFDIKKFSLEVVENMRESAIRRIFLATV